MNVILISDNKVLIKNTMQVLTAASEVIAGNSDDSLTIIASKTNGTRTRITLTITSTDLWLLAQTWCTYAARTGAV